MKLATVPTGEALGGILVHNVADARGHKALLKGHQLSAQDIEQLRTLDKREVYVALMEEGDVRENEAVTRIAHAIADQDLNVTTASGGRVNLLATSRGIVKLNAEELRRLNSIPGVTIATIPENSVVAPKKMVATVKTIGLALPERALIQVEDIARECGAAVRVRALPETDVAVIFTGSAESQVRVEETFTPAIKGRVEELGGQIVSSVQVREDPSQIAGAVRAAVANGAACVIIAGETSIMDADDITPRGIVEAGGRIELYGVPVEPGNLLLLGYCGQVPVVGAPGCVKSRDTNVVDLILPRLLAGEQITRADVIELGIGGLLL